jgi:hypothetical protein
MASLSGVEIDFVVVINIVQRYRIGEILISKASKDAIGAAFHDRPGIFRRQ